VQSAPMAGRVDAAATRALIAGTREALVDALADEAAQNSGHQDWRDVLIGFAPFYDAAQRLGFDTVDIFDAAADRAPEDVAVLMRPFGRRTDVALHLFGWVLEDYAYRFALGGRA
jgi:hypothetical protein